MNDKQFSIAREFLKKEYLILDERKDRGIIFVRDSIAEDVICVLVRCHKRRINGHRIARSRRMKVREAFRQWLHANKWRGRHSYHAVEVYGFRSPIIDHITGIDLR